MHPVVGQCPVCGDELTVTRLHCRACDTNTDDVGDARLRPSHKNRSLGSDSPAQVSPDGKAREANESRDAPCGRCSDKIGFHYLFTLTYCKHKITR